MDAFLAVLTGFLGAVLAGMFGIGGAGLTTLALRLLLRTSPGIALGTTLPAVIPTAVAGAFTYRKQGLVDGEVAAWCSAGGAAGSVLGAYLTTLLNLHYLMILTGMVVLYIAYTTIRKGLSMRSTALPSAGKTGRRTQAAGRCRRGIPAFLLIGLLSGFYSGLLGLGGGIVLVPAMVTLLGMPIKKAFGTSLAVIAVIAVPGTLIHCLAGHVSGWLFLYLTVGVIPGAYLGAKVSIRSKESVLFVCFGVIVLILGVAFIANEIISMAG